MASETLKALKDAVKGLKFESESDKPVKAFEWDAKAFGETFTPEAVAKYVKAEDGKIATVPVDEFFAPMTTPHDWHGDAEKERVARFTRLVEILKTHLTDLIAVRLGEIKIAAYVVGKTKEGNFAGVSTQLIET